MKKRIIILVVIMVLALAGVIIATTQPQKLGQEIPIVIGFFETSLATKISSSATTMTLVTGTDGDDASLSGLYGFVIDEGSSSEEVVIATCTATACSAMRRGVSITDGWTEVTANQKSHRRGASVKMTNFPQLAILTRVVNGNESFPNALTMDGKMTYSVAPSFTSDLDVISKQYSDNQANQGAATSTDTAGGISIRATRIENASSTAFDADNPHYQSSEHSTSTPSANIATEGNGIWDVWSEIGGKISQLWLDLTEVFAFSGNNTHSGDETFSGSVDMASTTIDNLVTSNIKTSFTAGGSFTAGDALSIGPYSTSTDIITFDASATGSDTQSAGSHVKTISHTIADEDNRVLFLTIGFNGLSQNISAVTYAGDAMTLVDSEEMADSSHKLYVYKLFAPDTGVNNISVSYGTSGGGSTLGFISQSYYNVAQTTDSETGSATGSVVNTPTTDYVTAVTAFGDSGGTVVNANTNRVEVETYEDISMANSGIIFPKKATTISDSTASASITVGLAPSATYHTGVVKADASDLANICNVNLYNGFIGFADITVATSTVFNVNILGIENNQTSLLENTTYYLSDTAGAIGISAGTNSVKVGVGISDTELLIKQDN